MNVLNNPILDIAEAPSRKTKVWKNHKVQWSELLDKMSSPVRTNETMAEYRAMSRDDQAASKDVGGFVGGFCNNGSRSDVRFRSVLCLDADYADEFLWDDWALSYGNAAAMYSTRKHTPDKPRYRLVIPLSRDVTPDEYPAIGRKIAETLGIDKFDDTTYTPSRLMYYPSVSSDGEFVFEHLDAQILDPDSVLKQYTDWRDISSWPMSSRVTDIAKKATSKQADPLTKSGLVGAFCRAYSIEEAISEFVPQYEYCEEGRYTYTDGSTAGGVMTYEGKFSYSFHATDPASGQLCNAFDLVRIHMFGTEDDGIDPTKSITERPSFKAMQNFAASNSTVKELILKERLEEAMSDFDSPIDDDDWASQMDIDKNGTIKPTIKNCVLILEHDPNLAGHLFFNEFQQNIIWVGDAPWDRNSSSAWNDTDDASLRAYLESRYQLSGKDKIFDAVNVVSNKNHVHPVRSFLDSCEWDEIPRVETLLVDYLGAEDTPYTRAVTRKTMVAAVARIYKPGIKFDYMLTIRGKQGLGKSALIKKLGGDWYSDSFSTLQGKDAYEQVIGSWIIEVGELAGMKKAEAETIKLFISKQVDRFRPAYGRRTQEFPRQCVFVGTTNESQFLRDTTGNRRFWVVDTPNKPSCSIWDDLTASEVRQIWAEAVQMFYAGEDLFLDKDLEGVAQSTQSEYEEENPKTGLVLAFLERLLPEDWEKMGTYDRRRWLESDADGTVPRKVVSNIELWAEAIGSNPDKMDRYASKEMSDIMMKIPGWERAKDRMQIKPYGQQRYYYRSNE